nr:reverse transcriptase domain-containing protein [Tanacetum cinerariifolium]
AEEAHDELEVEEASVEPEAEGADVELEAEEPDGESSTARDPQFVGGLAPWALRRNLEALRRHERIREAESETSRTEVALLGSEAKIGKMEREILHHDLSGVEETLGKVVERLKVLESEEDTTLRKKLAENELIQDKADEATEGEKRKGKSDRGGCGDNRREHNRRQNQRRGNAGVMTNDAPNNNETCQKCKNKRHAGDCWKCTKCELGSFDVVIGMDWLSKNDVAILCGEKKVRIPLKNKALIIE